MGKAPNEVFTRNYAEDRAKLDRLLIEHDKTGQPLSKQLASAGELACESLTHLLEFETAFWAWMATPRPAEPVETHYFDSAVLPASVAMLDRLGYTPPPPSRDLIAAATKAIRKDTNSQASSPKEAVVRLRNDICGLSKSVQIQVGKPASPSTAAKLIASAKRLNKKVWAGIGALSAVIALGQFGGYLPDRIPPPAPPPIVAPAQVPTPQAKAPPVDPLLWHLLGHADDDDFEDWLPRKAPPG